MSTKTIELDLNDLKPAIEIIGAKKTEIIASFIIDKAVKKTLFFEKEVDCHYDIEITDVAIPTRLHINNPNVFITLKSDQLGLLANSKLSQVPIQSNGIVFSIQVDLSKIIDVVAGQTRDRHTVHEIPISFKVNQQCIEYGEINDSKQYFFTLAIKPFKAQVDASYQIVLDTFEQGGIGKTHVGNLLFVIKKGFGYFYHEDFKVSIELEENTPEELIEADLENIPQQLMDNTNLGIPIFCQSNYLEHLNQSYEILGKILVADRDTVIAEEIIVLEILPDSSKTEIQVELSDEELIKNEEEYHLKNNVKWKSKERNGQMTCFELKITNLAQSGDGLVRIRGLELVKIDYDKNKIELEKSGSQLFYFEDMDSVELKNKENSFHKSRLKFRHDSIKSIDKYPVKVDATLTFDYCLTKQSEAIKEIESLFACLKCYREKVHTIRLQVDEETICPRCGSKKAGFMKLIPRNKEFSKVLSSYQKEKMGNKENHLKWETFTTLISFSLEEDTGNTWLAIDFGTSASVVAMADSHTLQIGKEQDIFINMNDALFQLYGQNYHKFDFGEKDNKIISSSILLKPTLNDEEKTYLNSTNYEEDVVQISPPKEIQQENSPYSIPYLKSLIGFENIPDLNGTYKTLSYYERQDSVNPVSFADRPLKVQEVLRNVYNSLLRDFIKPQLKNGFTTDKIIFSIPNTFTPKQVEIIRDIVDYEFDDFKSEYVSFISESDAVACEYISNWNPHNKNRPDKGEMLKQDESILVFDVGAGTTDLTLFQIVRHLDLGRKDLNILGKLGKGTAGNYLDYVIASIIDDLSENENKMTYKAKFPNDYDEVAHANKYFIKSYIKPKLQQADQAFYVLKNGILADSPNRDGGGKEIYIGAIVDHPLMQEFLHENSTELIEQFFNLFAGTAPSISGEFNQTKIHTIIFSGRGVLFGRLRKSFETALTAFISKEYQPYIIFQEDPEKLKSVVVKGALNYASEFRNKEHSSVKMNSKNLMARYGFLYKNPNTNLWEFLEVLNPSTVAINGIPHDKFGLNIFEYDSDVENAQGDPSKMTIDLSSTSIGYFVQSYSKDTAKDFNERKLDYITIIYQFSRGNIASSTNIRNVPVRVQINEENQMSVTIGREEKDFRTPINIDFSTNETFKKSLWPYA